MLPAFGADQFTDVGTVCFFFFGQLFLGLDSTFQVVGVAGVLFTVFIPDPDE